MGFYSRKQVLEMTTWSPVTLWRRVKDGDFPSPIKISPGRVAWSREAVHQWIEEKTRHAA